MMPFPVMPPATCTCGHLLAEHSQYGVCQQETCMCEAYAELCLHCRHAVSAHDGPVGECTRVLLIKRVPCGCLRYQNRGGS